MSSLIISPLAVGSNSEATNKTFTPFPRLPVELRDKIWETAIPGPRLVTMRVQLQQQHDKPLNKLAESNKIRIATDADVIPTALLHTNVESRNLALRHYEEAFDGIDGFRQIFFDFKRDILCLEGDRVLARFCDGDLNPCPYGYHQVRFVPPGVEAWQKKVHHVALSVDVSLEFNLLRLLDLVKGGLRVLYVEISFDDVKERRAEADCLRRLLIEGWMKTLGTIDRNVLPEIEFVSQQLRRMGVVN
ncbi:hypothetical protein IFR05_007754 [Cadophora sp. M221]|nr:hypothetical protein IFR05_007754 [Cadophora sp. M221]